MPNHQKSPKLRPSRHRKFPKLRRGGVTPHEVRRQHQSLAFAYGLRPAPARPRICPPAPGILVDRVEGQRAHAPLAGAQLPDRLPTRPALPGRAKFRRQQEPPSRRSTCQLGDREAGSPGCRTGRSARSAPRRARRSPRRVIDMREINGHKALRVFAVSDNHGAAWHGPTPASHIRYRRPASTVDGANLRSSGGNLQVGIAEHQYQCAVSALASATCRTG